MLPLAASAQMKELDRLAIEEQGVPSMELMERAAQAVADTLANDTDPMIPATLLKTHPCFDLFLDEDSASLIKDR